MKMSKKICSLLLVVCVLCTVVPAFARTETVPAGFPADGFVLDNAEGVIANQVQINLTDEALKAVAANSGANGAKLSGSFTVAGKTYALDSDATVVFSEADKISVYTTGFLYSSEEFKAAMKASDIPDFDRDANGEIIMATAGNDAVIFKRNIFRFLLTEIGEDYKNYSNTALENGLDIPMTFTGTVKATQSLEVGNLPEGTIFLATSVINKDTPASGWKNFQGIWQQATVSGDSGIDGPWMTFVAPADGVYNVWAYKRDQRNVPDQRDIYLDVSGTNLKFEQAVNPETGEKYAPATIAGTSNNGHYWEPEFDGKTVTLQRGQKVYVRILSKTGNFAGAYGFAFVPTDKNVHPDKVLATNEVTNFFNTLSVKSLTPHAEAALVTKTVTVNGVSVTAKERDAFKQFPRVKRYDLNGNYIEAPTVLDALIAADAADDSYEITSADLSNVAITVNGKKCKEAAQVLVQDGDVIEAEKFVLDKTSFDPVGGDGRLTSNGGFGSADGLALAGISGYTYKITTNGNAATNFAWPVDITQTDALAGCYLNGYAKVKADLTADNAGGNDKKFTAAAPTDGDDTLVTVFIQDWKIDHSAVQASSGRLELAITPSTSLRVIEVDGVKYHISNNLIGGAMQQGLYDLSNLYITNTESAGEVKVIAENLGNGAYNLTATKAVPVCLMRVVKDENGAITSVNMENTILSFAERDTKYVAVGDNETVYVWEGTFLGNGTANMKPLCAPLTK